MPVVTRWRASMLTLKAVPKRLVFLVTIGSMSSSSSRSAMQGMQIRPPPVLAMKAIHSGVTISAAMARSPSFSRSSSSTMMTGRPALNSSIASGMVASGIACLFNTRLGTPAYQALQVAGDDVRLEVHAGSPFVASGHRALKGVRDQRDGEGPPVVVHPGHGEAGPVDGYGTLFGDVAGDLRRELDLDLEAQSYRPHRLDRGGRVDVALDQVAVEE